MEALRELHVFAGAGGGILGGLLLGHVPVCAVELEEYPRRILLQRQRDGILPWFPVWDDVRTFRGEPWAGKVDVIAGGFPCTDISIVGKGAGIDGKQSGLWSEMARIIGEVRPRFVFVENSSQLIRRGLGKVLGDLASMGFDAWWCVLAACNAGAPHLRERIWILAHANGNRLEREREPGAKEGDPGSGITQDGDSTLDPVSMLRREMVHAAPDPCFRVPMPGDRGMGDTGPLWPPVMGEEGDWAEWLANGGPEPGVLRRADGVANRMERIQAVGNGQVPIVAKRAWETLMQRIQQS